MPHYYVNDNAQPNGDHEVHAEGCAYIPQAENRTYLGIHLTCQAAIEVAITIYDQVDGCYYCSRDCHRS